MTPSVALTVLIRFLHVASITTLVGGAFFAWVGAQGFTDEVAARWRPVVIGAVAVAFLSGLYTLLNKAFTPEGYHMWFGIKFLFALHVMAVSVLACRNGVSVAKRRRMFQGATVAGLLIVAISARLRWM